ncbi:MAG TPA: non-ribosomal peptide synthetase [Casimicrobiaceae bacterium]|nr:non-ribosomal peptide synthetase [Casimicrobiaceae bacterium]
MPEASGSVTLLELLEAKARERGWASALLAPARPPLSYEALLLHVERTGARLAALGLARGQRIALALPNGPEMAAAIVSAVSWASCAPLNPASDEALCRFLLATMRVGALIVAEDAEPPAVKAARALGVPVVRLAFAHGDPGGVFSLRAENKLAVASPERARPEDVGLLLHTSGTTARPKVVPVAHRSLVASFCARAELIQLTHADRCLCMAPLFTSAGVRRNLGPALAAGASIVCTPGFDHDRFFAWLAEFQPTYYAAPPTVHRAVLDGIERSGSAPQHGLRYVLSTSATLPTALQERLERVLSVPVLQTYAMTEAGQITHDPLPPAPRKPGSVGLPAGGCEVRVIGEDGFLRAGETGEIMVRGGEVFAGYEANPDANALAFHDGWFRTGDLGYVDADGYVYLTGRVKELINRGGLKVSPTAVDAALLQHAAVAEAATFGVPHPTLGEDVIAAVVTRHPAVVTEQELRDFALGRLALHMVPSRIAFVPELPKTPLGKVMRGSLAARFGEWLGEFIAPRDEHERLVAVWFAEVLGSERVGALDNFFDLGGDSLRGAQVVMRANLALGLALSVESLFRRPTVAEFAAELRAGATSGGASAPPPIRPRARPPVASSGRRS